MRSRYRILQEHHAHFVTGTIVAWLPVFTTAARCDILVHALEYCCARKGLKIHAWVILDNHFHAILSGPDLAQVLGDLKRRTARRLIEQLEADGWAWLLDQLQRFRLKHKIESRHQVWQAGSHPQAMMSDAIMEQKLEYLHNNPVKRGLVASPEHWPYSSEHEWLACSAVGLTGRWVALGGPGRRSATSQGSCVPKCNLGTRDEGSSARMTERAVVTSA